MSYDARNLTRTEFQTVWSDSSNSLSVSSLNSSYQELSPPQTFSLDTTGSGELLISSNEASHEEDLNMFWSGDHSATSNTYNYYLLFSIEFKDNDQAVNRGYQSSRGSMADDQFYSINKKASIIMKYAQRSAGSTNTPYVRAIGVIIGE